MSTATPLDDLRVGHVVGERYRIETLLGEGGVGRVYRAVHTALGRAVALKVLLTEHEGSGILRERFRREAEALAALSHPHIVAVTDFGVDGEMPYLVMELLEGSSLAEILSHERLAPPHAIAIIRQILLALGYAHARGVVHRDLKPHNVFVRRLDDGSSHVTVLDFGLARFVGGSRGGATPLTRVGAVIGTPAYMAPEQASGDVDAIDARTDVYAAGLLLFEVLCGRRPFPGNDPTQLMRAHLLTSAPGLTETDPSLRVSPALEALVARALAKRADDRFADATEMLAALDALDHDAAKRDPSAPLPPRSDRDLLSMVSAPTMAAGPSAKQRSSPRVESGAMPTSARSSRAPFAIGAVLAIAAALGLLVIGVVVTVVWLGPEEAVEPTPRPEPEIAPPEEPAPQAPAAPSLHDPFDAPLPEPIAALNARVQRGGVLSRTQVRTIRTWARENGDDVRSYLILGHSYTNDRALSYAFPEYESAMQRDPSARGYPEMLPDLLEMARSGALTARASNAIASWYGAEAIPSVEQELADPELRSEERRRLLSLRERLEESH